MLLDYGGSVVLLLLLVVANQALRSSKFNSYSRKTLNLNDFSSVQHCIVDVNSNILKFAAAGAAAGGCRSLSRGLTYPLDTIKTLKQIYGENDNDLHSSVSEFDYSKPNQRSVKEYFRGVVPALLSAIPAQAIFFSIYNYLDDNYLCFLLLPFASGVVSGGIDSVTTGGGSSWDTILRRLFFSAIANLPPNLIKIPSELIKQRSQVQGRISSDTGTKQVELNLGKNREAATNMSIITHKEPIANANWLSITRDIIHENGGGLIGVRGLYQGGAAQLIRDIPYSSVQITVFEFLKEKVASAAANAPTLSSSVPPTSPQPATLLDYTAVMPSAIHKSFELPAGVPIDARMLDAEALMHSMGYFLHSAGVIETVAVGWIGSVVVHLYRTMDSKLFSAAIGMVAACVAAIFTQPADVVKTKLMATTKAGDGKQPQGTIQTVELPAVAAVGGTTTLYSMVKSIYELEGVSGFFVGIIPRLGIVSVGGLVYFYAVESVQQQFFKF